MEESLEQRSSSQADQPDEDCGDRRTGRRHSGSHDPDSSDGWCEPGHGVVVGRTPRGRVPSRPEGARARGPHEALTWRQVSSEMGRVRVPSLKHR